jgi:transcriptional regulator with XRE-family HTH domain
MRISAELVDTAVLQELGERLASLRLERNLKQADLAVEAGVSKRTVERMEAGGPTQLVNLVRVCRALGLLERLETLVPEVTISPVAQLIQQGKKRKRAAAVKVPKRASKWQWNDKP